MIKKLFAPSADSTLTSLALLVARVWFGLSIFFHHGLHKLENFRHGLDTFSDPLGIGRQTSFVLVVFAEAVCSLLIAAGLVTRFAALVLVINMSVAFYASKAMPDGGELAMLYLAAFAFVLIAGAGKFSLDKLVFRGASRSRV